MESPRKILFIERKAHEFVSIERVFRQIAAGLSSKYQAHFQQVQYGNKIFDTIRNLFFFQRTKADIYHITGHIHYLALLFSRSNTALTIHDLRFMDEPPGLKRSIIRKLYLEWPVKRLKYITAISQQTKDEIINELGCDEKKIRMIPVPLVGDLRSDNVKPFNFECPEILQIGTMKNKNLIRLCEALEGISCRLRIIGKLDDEQKATLKKHSLIFTNAFDLDDLAIKKEYENADIVAFCSTLEGFGLPIIEAQAMGKPVITSNIEPMIETSGKAAVLVDPFDVASIRNGINEIINNAELRSDLIERGVVNVDRFAPDTVAAEYERMYDEMLAAMN